jgi:hypothetical protein
MTIEWFVAVLLAGPTAFLVGLATMGWLRGRSDEHMSEFNSKLYDYRRTSRS